MEKTIYDVLRGVIEGGSDINLAVKFLQVKDRFGESGEPNELLEKFGLTAKNIVEAVKKIIKRK